MKKETALFALLIIPDCLNCSIADICDAIKARQVFVIDISDDTDKVMTVL